MSYAGKRKSSSTQSANRRLPYGLSDLGWQSEIREECFYFTPVPRTFVRCANYISLFRSLRINIFYRVWIDRNESKLCTDAVPAQPVSADCLGAAKYSDQAKPVSAVKY